MPSCRILRSPPIFRLTGAQSSRFMESWHSTGPSVSLSRSATNSHRSSRAFNQVHHQRMALSGASPAPNNANSSTATGNGGPKAVRSRIAASRSHDLRPWRPAGFSTALKPDPFTSGRIHFAVGPRARDTASHACCLHYRGEFQHLEAPAGIGCLPQAMMRQTTPTSAFFYLTLLGIAIRGQPTQLPRRHKRKHSLPLRLLLPAQITSFETHR